MPNSQVFIPLPPETRTVGQLIAEALRLYGEAFWRVLPLGLPVALVNQVAAGRALWVQVLILAAAAPLLTAAFVGACLMVLQERPPGRALATAFGAGVLVLLPTPLLMLVYVLPAVAWLAFLGLVVPAAMVERLPFREAFPRAVRLARADYAHALGTLAAVVVLFAVTKLMLVVLLHGQADATERIALFLADLVLSPLLFLGPALLYLDQAARVVGSGPRSRRNGAHVHLAVEPDGAGRPDAEVEP